MSAHRDAIISAVRQALDAGGVRTQGFTRPALLELFSSPSPSALRGGGTPIVYDLLTPLAEGADRIVADAVAALDGACIIPVLPMPQAEYEGTFGDEGLVTDFRTRLDAYDPAVRLRDTAVELDIALPELGRYLVDHCDVLIAIWNGKPGGVGGTAEVVAYAHQQRRPMLVIDPKAGAVAEAFHGNGISCPGFDRFVKVNEVKVDRADLIPATRTLLSTAGALLQGAHQARVQLLAEHLMHLYIR